MKKKYWILLALLVIGIIAAIVISQNSDKEEDKKDNYALPIIKTIENKQLISGRLASSKEVNIKSELAGIIDALYVNVGDEVKKGQAIAKIRTLPDPKSTQDASRQIEIAKINLERIQANYQRTKSLYEKEVISKQEYEIALQEYKSSQTELASAQNYMKIVKQGFSNKSDFVSNTIYSTIDGIVLDIPVKIGGSIQNRNTFSEGTTLATIADKTDFLFKGQINEKDLNHLSNGKIITIKVNAIKGQEFKAEITKLSPKGVDVGGITRFDIEAKLLVSAVDLYKFKSGYTATAEFSIDKKENVLSLEERYIQYNEDTAFVFVKNGDDKKRKVIETGISDGHFVEIKKGISKDDKIVKEIIKSEN